MDRIESAEHSDADTTESSSSPMMTTTMMMTGPHAPAVIIDRRRSSVRETHNISSRSYSPRSSICPYEWDGEPGAGKAKIYRLNPSSGQGKRRLVVSEAELEAEIEAEIEAKVGASQDS